MRLIKNLMISALTALIILTACATGSTPNATAVSDSIPSSPKPAATLLLPELSAVPLDGDRLQVIATTSIIGDVVKQVGGDAIELKTLLAPGQDPHSYEPAARDLTAVAAAHVIFINGWNLEETLAQDLVEISGDVPVVAISANIEPLLLGQDDHKHEDEENDATDGGADPHVWLSVRNVVQWVENVELVLSSLDPEHAAIYKNNAAAYQAELADLEAYAAAQIAQIPQEKRILVTNHDALSYFAQDYGFELIGTVIPAASTLAEPSARDLADLVAEMGARNVCTIFIETTASDALAQTVADEVTGCPVVKVVSLYTGSLGPAGSEADSYIKLFKFNVDAIVEGLH